MKLQQSCLTLGLLIAAAAPVWPAAAEPLTLRDAAAIGLGRSPELGQMQARTGAADAARDAAAREWLPKVSIDAAAGLRHLENDARINVGLSTVDEKPLYASVTVEQTLFDFGQRTSERKSRDAGFQAAQKDEAAAAEQIALSLSKAYLQSLVQERIVQAAQENLAFHEALASDVREGVTRGAMSIAEQQQAGERLQTARVRLSEAQNDRVAARESLALLLGRADIDVTMPDEAGALLPPTLEEATARAQAADPTVQAALARFHAARYGANRAEGARWPTVGLQGAYRHGKDFEGYRGLTKDAQGLVTVRWTLFDGGIAAAHVREASSREDEAGFALAAARRDSELQSRIGWQRLQSLRERLRAQEERKAIAGQVLESYKAQFGIGRRSLLDLLDAQAALYSSQVEAEMARVGLRLSEYGLLAQSRQLTEFLGVTPPRVVPPAPPPQ